MSRPLTIPCVLLALAATLPPAPPADAAALVAPELDQLAERRLKNARLNVDAAGRQTDELEAFIARWQGVEGVPLLQANVQQFEATMNGVVRSRDEALDFIGKLPAEHPDVQAVAAQLQGHLLRAQTAANAYRPIAERFNAALAAAQDVGNAGDLAADEETVRQVTQAYRNAEPTVTNAPAFAAELATNADEVEATLRTLADKYAGFVAAGSVRAREFGGSLRFAAQKLQEFRAAAEASVPLQVSRANEFLNAAEHNTAVRYGGKDAERIVGLGSIDQSLDFAGERIDLLTALGHPEAAPLADRLATLRKNVADARQADRERIIAENRVPADSYSGGDADVLKQAMVAEWKRSFPNDDVLAVVLPVTEWKRTTEWRWNGRDAFEKFDRSKLQGRLVVRDTQRPTEALLVPVDLYRYHLENDRLSAAAWERSTLGPEQRMLIANVE